MHIQGCTNYAVVPGINGEKQPVNTATVTVHTFTAGKVWFRNYYVCHAFVVCIKINNEELGFNAVPFYFSSA